LGPRMRRWLSTGPSVLILALVIFGAEPIGQSSQSSAGRTAADLLKEVPVPPGARPVSRMTSELLQHPAASIGCTPLVDKARFMMVYGTLQSVSTFLRSHHPERWAVQGSGGSVNGNTGNASSVVIYAPSVTAAAPQPDLVVTYAADGKGKVGIRVDAEVVPPDARCVYH
jgi:hypothetical protein